MFYFSTHENGLKNKIYSNIINGMYSYITINNYYNGNQKLESEKPLSSLSQPKETFSGLREWLLEQNPDSLTAATITVKPNKTLCYYDQVNRIEKALNQYNIDKSNKRVKYIGFMEDTKGGLPHMHLLIYNAYRAPFVRHFKPLGVRNGHDLSFQPVKNVLKYVEYISKEWSPSDKTYMKA